MTTQDNIAERILNAVQNGDPELLQGLLEQHPNADLSYEDNAIGTPLEAACILGHDDCLSLLINAGADINEQRTSGMTALMFAVLNRNADCVKVLLEADATVNLQMKEGRTALDYAKQANHSEIADMLAQELDYQEDRKQRQKEQQQRGRKEKLTSTNQNKHSSIRSYLRKRKLNIP